MHDWTCFNISIIHQGRKNISIKKWKTKIGFRGKGTLKVIIFYNQKLIINKIEKYFIQKQSKKKK